MLTYLIVELVTLKFEILLCLRFNKQMLLAKIS